MNIAFFSQRSLADEPLSWEGTASYADENGISVARGSAQQRAPESKVDDDEEILLTGESVHERARSGNDEK